MNMRKGICLGLCALTLLMLAACGGTAKTAEPRPGVVYLDPNAPAAATPVPGEEETTAAPAAETVATEPPVQEKPSAAEDLYFESRGVRIEPMMETAPVLAALGEPIGSFEADSCAYLGKDLFYYYPGFELTVNEVEGVNMITAISVVDDTVTIPQGLRIYDEEEKLLSILGGVEESGVYTYQSGRTVLLIQVKEGSDEIRRIATMEYRIAEEQ